MKPNAVTIDTTTTTLKDIPITTIVVRAPYNQNFVTAAQNLGGRWNGVGWMFNARTTIRVCETLRTIYGTDQADYVSVTARFDAGIWWRHDTTGDESTCYFAGRQILSRRERDSVVKLGNGVVLVEGSFSPSGGSVRYPSLDIDRGTIVEVYDVPADHADLTAEIVTIVPDTTPIDVDALMAERERIVARLNEINEVLDGIMLEDIADAFAEPRFGDVVLGPEIEVI